MNSYINILNDLNWTSNNEYYYTWFELYNVRFFIQKRSNNTRADPYNTQTYIRTIYACAFVRCWFICWLVPYYKYIQWICIRSVPLEWTLNYAKINSKCGSNNNIDIIHLAHTEISLRIIWFCRRRRRWRRRRNTNENEMKR